MMMGLRGSNLFLVQFIEGDGKHQQTFGILHHILEWWAIHQICSLKIQCYL